jgi:hypothetical protein
MIRPYIFESHVNHHHKFEKWYRNAIVAKPATKHYNISHATFPVYQRRIIYQPYDQDMEVRLN